MEVERKEERKASTYRSLHSCNSDDEWDSVCLCVGMFLNVCITVCVCVCVCVCVFLLGGQEITRQVSLLLSETRPLLLLMACINHTISHCLTHTHTHTHTKPHTQRKDSYTHCGMAASKLYCRTARLFITIF